MQGGLLIVIFTYDKANLEYIRQAGMLEKQVTLPDGSLINYGEGPKNGPPFTPDPWPASYLGRTTPRFLE